MTTVIRAQVAHTPRNPFLDERALEAVLERREGGESMLGALFALAREESIAEVRVGGRVVWPDGARRLDEVRGT